MTDMKKLFLILFSFVWLTGNIFARVDRYKTDVGIDKTINHITYELPLHFGKERSNLVGYYTLARNVGGKKSGSLSFDFKQTNNKFSQEIRNAMLRISKDLHYSNNSIIQISFTLSSGETFTFDGSYFRDWKSDEWHELIHVSYNEESKEYRTFIMFPLEYLKSNTTNMSRSASSRYKYVLKAIAKYNIVQIQVTDRSKSANINITIPIDRTTSETIADMQKKKINAKKIAKKESEKEKKSHAKSGRR